MRACVPEWECFVDTLSSLSLSLSLSLQLEAKRPHGNPTMISALPTGYGLTALACVSSGDPLWDVLRVGGVTSPHQARQSLRRMSDRVRAVGKRPLAVGKVADEQHAHEIQATVPRLSTTAADSSCITVPFESGQMSGGDAQPAPWDGHRLEEEAHLTGARGQFENDESLTREQLEQRQKGERADILAERQLDRCLRMEQCHARHRKRVADVASVALESITVIHADFVLAASHLFTETAIAATSTAAVMAASLLRVDIGARRAAESSSRASTSPPSGGGEESDDPSRRDEANSTEESDSPTIVETTDNDDPVGADVGATTDIQYTVCAADDERNTRGTLAQPTPNDTDPVATDAPWLYRRGIRTPRLPDDFTAEENAVALRRALPSWLREEDPNSNMFRFHGLPPSLEHAVDGTHQEELMLAPGRVQARATPPPPAVLLQEEYWDAKRDKFLYDDGEGAESHRVANEVPPAAAQPGASPDRSRGPSEPLPAPSTPRTRRLVNDHVDPSRREPPPPPFAFHLIAVTEGASPPDAGDEQPHYAVEGRDSVDKDVDSFPRGSDGRRIFPSPMTSSIMSPDVEMVSPPVAASPAAAAVLLQWDAARSGSRVSLTQQGTFLFTTALPVSSQTEAPEREHWGYDDPVNAVSSKGFFGLGTLGIASGEFVFEVRIGVDDRRAFRESELLSVRPSPQRRVTNPDAWYAVGVASKAFRGLDGPPCAAYMLRSDGAVTVASDARNGHAYALPLAADTTITVHLDLCRFQLSFFVEGLSLGPAIQFEPVQDPEPLFPIAVFGACGGWARLQPPSAPLPKRLSPGHVTLPSDDEGRRSNVVVTPPRYAREA